MLYVSGFSRGPGFPFPLLDSHLLKVIQVRMPYALMDHIHNPYIYLLLIFMALLVSFGPAFIDSSLGLGVKCIEVLALMFISFMVIKDLKCRIVDFCINECVLHHEACIKQERPEVIVSYSWGGGIANMLLERNSYNGPMILIASAGAMMVQASGRGQAISISNARTWTTIIHGTKGCYRGYRKE